MNEASRLAGILYSELQGRLPPEVVQRGVFKVLARIAEEASKMEAEIDSLRTGKNKPQRQDSVLAQLRDMIPVANREGCYDAADFLRGTVEDIEKKMEETA